MPDGELGEAIKRGKPISESVRIVSMGGHEGGGEEEGGARGISHPCDGSKASVHTRCPDGVGIGAKPRQEGLQGREDL